jgi:cytochrome c biogenesis protein CcmG/thiol:disulfide interchange protein DsbE
MTATAEAPVAAPPAEERPRHTARWAAIIIGVIVLLFIVLLATRKSADRESADSPLLGRPAPATSGPPISFSGPSQGASAGPSATSVSLDGFRGKYVLVNFFASWCIPCQQEQPDLKAFNDRHTPIGDAAVLGIVYDDKPDAVRSFLESKGGGWPVIDSSRAKVDWGVRGVPESFLVDPEGNVLYHIVGGVKDSDIETLLRQAKQVQQR